MLREGQERARACAGLSQRWRENKVQVWPSISSALKTRLTIVALFAVSFRSPLFIPLFAAFHDSASTACTDAETCPVQRPPSGYETLTVSTHPSSSKLCVGSPLSSPPGAQTKTSSLKKTLALLLPGHSLLASHSQLLQGHSPLARLLVFSPLSPALASRFLQSSLCHLSTRACRLPRLVARILSRPRTTTVQAPSCHPTQQH